MPKTNKGNSGETEQNKNRKREALIVRIFRAFKRYNDKKISRKKPKENDHERNERLVAESSRRIGFLTWWIAVAAVLSVIVSVFNYFAVQGQLNEMKRGSNQTADLISVAKTQANASLIQAKATLGQMDIMQGQLAAMNQQESDTRAQIRANIVLEPVVDTPKVASGVITGWEVNPIVKNVGETDAEDFTNYWYITEIVGPIVPIDPPCPKYNSAKQNLPPTILQAGSAAALIAVPLSMHDAIGAVNGWADIFVVGRFQYRDIFPTDPIYVVDWCERMVPNDLGKSLFSFINKREQTIEQK